jgi:hypothetical protein
MLTYDRTDQRPASFVLVRPLAHPQIERHLHMGWDTIKKYLDMPAQTPAGRPRSSKLDPYKATIAELLEKDPSARRRDRPAAPPAGLHRWRQILRQ